MTEPEKNASAIDAPEVAAYWEERRRYLQRLRQTPEMRRKYRRALAAYLCRRLLWSFGFFPVLIAFWVPFVMASFNPVVLASELIQMLQAFVDSNPEVQANMQSNLLIAWISVGFFFLVFDFIVSPFRSPYEYEADVYMKSWERLNQDKLPDQP